MNATVREQPREGTLIVSDAPVRMTEAEYLLRETRVACRSEYRQGASFLMSGGTEEHGVLIGNIVFTLKNQLRGKNCRVIPSDQRVRAGNLYYPDVVVTCGSRIYDSLNTTTLLNPTVVVEVLSDSTERIDRSEKLKNYCALPSLRSYLLVSQYSMQVEQYERGDADTWAFSIASGADAVIHLPGIGCELSLQEIYDELDMDAE